MDRIRSIKLIIAESNPVFREKLFSYLANEEDFEIKAQASDGKEMVKLCSELKPDVAILDAIMPGLNVIDTIKKIKESSSNTAILIVNAFNSKPRVLSILKAGAIGYLSGDTRNNELAEGVRQASKGEMVLETSTVMDLIRDYVIDKNDLGSKKELNQREIIVLKLVAKGLRNKEIANYLNICERTVEAHLYNVFGKIGAHSRTEAVISGVRQGWLSTTDIF